MKFTSIVFIFSLFSVNIIAQNPNKIALIIAISKYPVSSGWGELSSINDVKLIKDALLKQGFKDQNIAVLTDKQATLAGMKSAFDKYLIQRAQPGDIAVFHFSGHGQQIEMIMGMKLMDWMNLLSLMMRLFIIDWVLIIISVMICLGRNSNTSYKTW